MYDSPAPSSMGVDRSPSMLEELGYGLDQLAATIADLESRLDPVMRPPYDGPEKAGGIEPKPVQSVIRNQRDGLAAQTQRVAAILDRLEV